MFMNDSLKDEFGERAGAFLLSGTFLPIKM